jgi:tricorn protease
MFSLSRAIVGAASILLTFAVLQADAQTPTSLGYYRQPAISAEAIVFVAEGDIWRTNISGGAAQRLTTHAGEESNPAISPDGKSVAFTARYEGPAEVYVMPIAGGAPTRLTFDGDNARVQGWAKDNKVLYNTARYSDKPSARLYTVDINTRAVEAVPLADAAEGCYADTTLVFTRQPVNSDSVKRYEGGLAQKIWMWNGETEALPLTADYKGTSRQPMCGATRIYFLSNRDGTMNVWSMNAQGRDVQQHTRHADFDIRGASIFVSATSKTESIIYQRGADLYVLDTVTNASRKIDIALQSDFDQTRARWIKTPWDFVTHIEPSPTGDRVAITARGQLLVIPAGTGRRVEVTRVSEVRARRGVFSHDGKSIYAFADTSGEVELWRYPANGVGAAKQLTKNATVLRERAFPSPDGKWVVHTDKDRRLYLLNLMSGVDTEIDRSAFDGYENIVWSPDSRWLVLNKATENSFEAIHLIEVATKKITQLTSNRYIARDAAFSPDGKWLYFLSNRNLQSVVTSPWGERNPEPFFDRQTRIYALALDPAARWPFLPKDELQKTEPEKKPETRTPPNVLPTTTTPPATPPTIKPPAPPIPPPNKEEPTGSVSGGESAVDAKPVAGASTARETAQKVSPLVLAGLSDRLYEVPIPAGNYTALSTDGKRLYFQTVEATVERKISLRSVAIEAPGLTLPVIDLFFEDIRQYELTRDGKKIFIRRQNELFIFDAGKAAPPLPEQAKFAVNLRDWTYSLDPTEEWKQMFVDAWRMHRDYFYDKNMHGVDWPKARAKYEPLMARVTDRAEVNDVIAQMISELSALHSQVFTQDLRRGADAIDVGSLAANVEKTPLGFRVTKIFGGDPELLEERSPLARPEVNVKVGETITMVNGIPATASSLGELLRNQSGRQVLLSIQNATGKSRDVIVTPIDPRRDRELRYLAWELERSNIVSRASSNRIGYVHLQAMGPADIARWAREFYPVYQREGLILDLRYNRGGSIDSWIIEKLQRRAWHFWQSRDADQVRSNQQLAFRGHVVALIDAETYSDGETMAQGLRRLGIAPLIGMTTAGAGIWLSDQNRLRDNGLARAAEFGSFVDDGKERAWITESVGVAPDITVDNLPFATFNGSDKQLETAIGYLLDKMAKEPMRKPTPPAFPVMGK